MAFWLDVEMTHSALAACGDHCTSATSHDVRCWIHLGGVKGSSKSTTKSPVRLG